MTKLRISKGKGFNEQRTAFRRAVEEKLMARPTENLASNLPAIDRLAGDEDAAADRPPRLSGGTTLPELRRVLRFASARHATAENCAVRIGQRAGGFCCCKRRFSAIVRAPYRWHGSWKIVLALVIMALGSIRVKPFWLCGPTLPRHDLERQWRPLNSSLRLLEMRQALTKGVKILKPGH
jgi:hypothetical protein